MTIDMARLKQLEKEALSGPWYVVQDPPGGPPYYYVCAINRGQGSEVGEYPVAETIERRCDAEFIAAARAAVPELPAEIARLKAALEPFADCCERYFETGNLPMPYLDNYARAAKAYRGKT